MRISPIEVTPVGHFGSDLNVVNAARVSFHKESQEFVEQDAKLINYLAKHNHKSPFNHCFLSFRVKAPILVARQLVKHEYLPWNEVSRRYVDDEPELMAFQWRLSADNVKQGSAGCVSPELQKEADQRYYALVEHSLSIYDWMLTQGISAEQARACLLLSTQTEWIWSGTLFAFVKMLKLRLDPHTQKETQEVAKLIEPYIQQAFPVSYNALKEHTYAQ